MSIDSVVPALVATVPLHEGYFRYTALTVRLPSGSVVRREVTEHPPAAAVLAYDPKRGTVFLVRQFRAPVFAVAGEGAFTEVCAGRIDGEEPAAEAARRELAEECGLDATRLDEVATLWPMPGTSTERITFFLAEVDATTRSKGGGLDSEQEEITVEEVPIAHLVGPERYRLAPDLKSQFLIDRLIERLGR